jgi:hypothetical protein
MGFLCFEMAGRGYFDTIDKPNPAFTLLDKNHDCVI